MSLSALRYRKNDIKTMPLRGRPASVSMEVITAASLIAEERDMMKDSFASNEDLMSVVDSLRREEQEKLGKNPLARLPVLSRSTTTKVVKLITPVTMINGSVKNNTRPKAFLDLISCAACWDAITEGIFNGKFVHSWDECNIMLSAFNEKRKVKCTVKKISGKKFNTEKQQQRRILKMGLSE